MIRENQHELFAIPDGVETRWASPENPKGVKGAAAQTNGGRKGRAHLPIRAGETLVLAEATGVSGVVRRIWLTFNIRTPKMMRSLKIEFFWDGSNKPAVSAPIGDFFGIGLGRNAAYQNVFFSSPEGRSYNCAIPMPFRTGMKIAITNEGDQDLPNLFYDVNYTIGDRHADNVGYFHAHYRRENLTTLKKDYEFLPKVRGAGRFLGVNVGMIANREYYGGNWWGEGECKVYLDGDDEFPTLAGTGTEDYIGSAWCLGEYVNMYQGCPIADGENMQYCFYRYHVQDPIYFRQDIRVTMQQIGVWGPGTIAEFKKRGLDYYIAGPGLEKLDCSVPENVPGIGLFERQDDWSSCAYFYLNRPDNDLPAIDPVEQRIAGLIDPGAIKGEVQP